MDDNNTLYIIVGLVLLLAVINTNAQPSVGGGPAMSAYLKKKVSKKSTKVVKGFDSTNSC
jgi:hypothetical protein